MANSIFKSLYSLTRKYKMPVVINVAGLALAFTAFLVIMMQVYYDRTYNEGIKDYDKVFMAYNVTDEYGDFTSMSPPMMEFIAGRSPHIKDYAYTDYMGMAYTFYVEDKAVKDKLLMVSPSLPEVFGFEMVAGTIDCMKDMKSGIIPESFARRYFGSIDVVGKTLTRDSSIIVGGVYKDLPANSSMKNIVYSPINPAWYADLWESWGFNSFTMYIKVDDPSAIDGIRESVNAGLKEINSEMRKGIDYVSLKDLHYTKEISGLLEAPVKESTEQMLISIAILTILIAVINFTNFSNALIPVRIRSINTRKIMGATRRSLTLSLVAESALTSVVACLLAFLFVELLSMTSFVNITTAGISLTEYMPVTVLTIAIAALTGIFAGIIPALRMTSYSPAVVLKGNFGLSPKGQMMRNVMVGVQFFVAAALIVAASLMQKQRDYMTRSIDYGFDKDEIVVCDINPPANTPADKSSIVNDMHALPFVENTSASWSVLAEDKNSQGWVFQTPEGDKIDPRTMFCGSGYMTTMGIKILEGRDFNDSDTAAVIINKLTAEKFGDVMNVGKQINFGKQHFTVVGICDNVIYSSLYNPTEPVMFVDMPYPLGNLNVRVRKGTNMFEAMDGIRKVLDSYDPGYPFNVRIYDQIMDATYQKERKLTTQITLFSTLAVLISVMGVFGLVMFDSEYRKREIAVRKVFGATTSGVVGMFNTKYLRILAVSCVLSIPAAWYFTDKWMQNFAYRTEMSWWIYALAFAGLAIITVATVSYQCRKIARTNPVESLKYE